MVEILPWRVVTQNNTKFTMRARVKDGWGDILLDWRANAVHWSTLGGGSVPTSPGGSIVVDASAPAASLPLSFQLIATIEGVADTVTITILPGGPPSGTSIDWIEGSHSINPQPDPPTIALVDGTVLSQTSDAAVQTLPVNVSDTVIAFVLAGSLDAFDCPSGSNCGELTVFPPGNAIVRDTVTWTAGCDLVKLVSSVTQPTWCPQLQPTLRSLQPLKPISHIRVNVWKASSAVDVDGKVDADVEYARSVFNRPGTGLFLDFKVRSTGTSVGTVTFLVPCQNSDLVAQLPINRASFQPDTVSVVYVDELSAHNWVTSETGFTCLYDPVYGPIVMISTYGLGTSTLAHELGHAIGGWLNQDPQPFHSDSFAGFESSNLMWSADPDTTRGLRVNLSLGQLFQMSYRDGSYIHQLPAPPYASVRCYPDPTGSLCPVPGKDVR